MSSENNTVNLRKIVLSMLLETLEKGRFSNVVVNKTYAKYQLDPRDRAFISRLYSGCLERLLWLDYTVDAYSSVPVRKMKPAVRNILRLSLYQMKFMDSVPDHAAINEAVKLAVKRGFGSLRSFINGVLRAIQRGGRNIDYPAYIEYSCPEWLYDLLVKSYGAETANSFLRRTINPESGITARLNLNNGSAEMIKAQLEKEGCTVADIPDFPEAVNIKGFESITSLSPFRQGSIFIQDLNSMRVADEAAKASDTEQPFILDVCAAPGGKSLHMAELFPKGKVTACDISETKTDLIDENIRRMGYRNISSCVQDAREFRSEWKGIADIVIADLPCSGLGVIGRKPDIKYRVSEKDLDDLAELQREILANVSGYVKKGGVLVYSTCTVNKAENEENALWFEKTSGFEMLSAKQYIDEKDGSDGFFISVFRKN
ncbi:MAG: 16S rRNA (cytosine(967)-C(5))-methyltransferase RsmB [Lachnospiraceae bacterium]|nr:16S rRNA (cytosine(967)-C(5))-methyltransferase RsmB [Lachnospiraceae bacterium]